MMISHDVVVIGTGSAGSTVASSCRSRGWKVAIVDSRPFGGTCALRGCDPKKVLVGAAEVIDWNRRMEGKGIRADGLQIEWPELMRFKRTFTDPVPQKREESLKKAGIDLFHGRARFVDPSAVQIGSDVLEGRYTVVAAGAKPAAMNLPGSDLVATSDEFLELDALPPRILFIGGGYISFEFAHVAARAGSRVTIVHRGARPLGGFDPDLVDQLLKKTRALGVGVLLGTEVRGIEKRKASTVVHAFSEGKELTLETDMVVHGAGRVPDIDDLDLAKAGVEREASGIQVNEYLQSVSNSRVYAAGDAAGSGPPLTPVAGHDGQIVAANILEGNHRKPNYSAVPTVVFTVPPLASVGLQEEAARAKGLRFQTNHQDTSSWYTSRRVAEDCSGFKVLVEQESGRILGAHLLGPHAEEIINFFALAIRAGIVKDALKETIFAYPTAASDLKYML